MSPRFCILKEVLIRHFVFSDYGRNCLATYLWNRIPEFETMNLYFVWCIELSKDSHESWKYNKRFLASFRRVSVPGLWLEVPFDNLTLESIILSVRLVLCHITEMGSFAAIWIMSSGLAATLLKPCCNTQNLKILSNHILIKDKIYWFFFQSVICFLLKNPFYIVILIRENVKLHWKSQVFLVLIAWLAGVIFHNLGYMFSGPHMVLMFLWRNHLLWTQYPSAWLDVFSWSF